MRLQHVSVPAPLHSSEDARAFYGGLLGLREKPVPASFEADRFLWFEAGPDELEVHVLLVDAPAGRTGAHFCLNVADLEGLRSRLEEAGVEIEEAQPIENRPRFFCHDPFGNRIELTSIAGPYPTR
ncbi:MAG TPA: VOC family protein [Gaiellaceae bacterium]|nr:VOC family protein [Gaiellaceae bacterium]